MWCQNKKGFEYNLVWELSFDWSYRLNTLISWLVRYFTLRLNNLMFNYVFYPTYIVYVYFTNVCV